MAEPQEPSATTPIGSGPPAKQSMSFDRVELQNIAAALAEYAVDAPTINAMRERFAAALDQDEFSRDPLRPAVFHVEDEEPGTGRDFRWVRNGIEVVHLNINAVGVEFYVFDRDTELVVAEAEHAFTSEP